MDTEKLTAEVRGVRQTLDALLAALQPEDDGTGGDPVQSLTEAIQELARAVEAQGSLVNVLSQDVRAVRVVLSGMPLRAVA